VGKTIVIAGFAGAMLGAAAISAAVYMRGEGIPMGSAGVTSPELVHQAFQATAGSTGIPGLTAPAPAKIAVVPVVAGSVPEVRLFGVQSNAASQGTPGIWIRVPDEFERAASGQSVRVTVAARRAEGAPNSSFSVAYSTGEVGNSGWRRFTVGDRLESYSFVYDVSPMVKGLQDYIGILPDPEGTDGAVQVAQITAEVFARGASMPLPPAAPVAPASSAAPAATPPAPPESDSKSDAVVPGVAPGHRIVPSAYYDIDVAKVEIPQIGRRGGIALLGKGLFVATHSGGTYFLPDLGKPSADSIVPLKEKLPFDLSSPKLKRFDPATLSVLGAAAEPSTTVTDQTPGTSMSRCMSSMNRMTAWPSPCIAPR
jgi:hypothetical protein